MSSLNTISVQHLPEQGFVTLIKRTLEGSGEPHIVLVSEIDTIKKLLQMSQRIFDADTPPRIFTENNCPIPYMCWPDTLLGTGRSGQHFYLEIYEQQYTKGINRSCLIRSSPMYAYDVKPPLDEIRPVILVDYPTGLFSTHPLPDDLIVELVSPDLRFETLAGNIKAFLSREFYPNFSFTVGFEDAENNDFDPQKTLAESGIINGVLVHCRLKLHVLDSTRASNGLSLA